MKRPTSLLDKGKKRVLGFILAATVAFTGVPFPTPQLKAAEGEIQVTGTGEVSSNETRTVTISNNNLSRTFEIKDGKLTPGTINNLLGKSSFTPQEGSEEFVIKTIPNAGTIKEPEEGSLTSVRSKDGTDNWEVKGNSVYSGSNDDGGEYDALLDEAITPHYHSSYSKQPWPVQLTLDRGGRKSNSFQTFAWKPRAGGSNTNGQIKEFELYASDTEDGLFEANNQLVFATGSKTGIMEAAAYAGGNNPKWIYTALQEKCNKRFIGIKVKSTHNSQQFVAGTGIDLIEEKFTTEMVGAVSQNDIPGDILASNLVLKNVTAVEHQANGGREGNEGKKQGQLLTFTFEPIKWGEGNATIEQKVVMYEGDHYMRKWIEIGFDENAHTGIRIAYIDGEFWYTTPSAEDLDAPRPANKEGTAKDIIWTIPPNSGGIEGSTEPRADMGQPVYINGMFMGSEFPAAQNKIELAQDTENEPSGTRLAISRYYTGKNIDDFARDGQITKDNKFVSWQTVTGASRSNGLDQSVIQQDFFSYIQDIATPSNFRIQYNSWYDNMMFIDDNNIMEAFKGIDKNLVKTGVRPLDSYVVDDGWNNYRRLPDQYNSGDNLRRNGEAGDVNESGFWEFNSKFPNGLTTSSTYVRNMGSYFGVWIGPRGGYNYMDQLALIIQNGVTDENGNHVQYGSAAGGSIDVADARYIKKYIEMVQEWTDEYKINYWKWDGFANTGQYNAFSAGNLETVGYSESNQHMHGGPNNFYHMTDHWEKWITVMEETRKSAAKNDIDNLWISITCYVNPSPWYLQWANSVWMQCQADRGERWNSQLGDKMNGMLTYRDAVYYDFIVNHEFQFPLSNIYNHDPIYGKQDTGIVANSMDGEMFRNYLFMQGTRGTAFWELYYSDSIFNEEKYLINADFLEWAENNYDLLKNAIMIGKSPESNTRLNTGGTSTSSGTQDPYGFSCFNGKEGIISMRNPDDVAKEFTFTLNESIGVKEAANFIMWKDHVYAQNNGEISGYTKNSQTPTDSTFAKNDKVSITLQPGETQIWHLKEGGDKVAPKLDKLYVKDASTLQVRASERLDNKDITVKVNGQVIDADNITKVADLRTFMITLDAPLTDGEDITVEISGAKDLAGNPLVGSIQNTYYENNQIVNQKNLTGATGLLSGSERSVSGNQGFAVSAEVVYKEADVKLVAQGEEYTLGINGSGQPYFTFNGVTATADTAMENGKTYLLTGVRENNDQVRLYVNNQISKAAYNEEKLGYETKSGDITFATGNNQVSNVIVHANAVGYDELPLTDLEELIQEIESSKDMYTSESWDSSGVEEALTAAKEAVKNNNDEEKNMAYNALMEAYGKLIPVTLKNYALRKEPTAQWLDSNRAQSITNGGSPLSKATDGVNNNYGSHAIVGNYQHPAPAYMQIDLGETVEIDNVQLYRYWGDTRTYSATAFVVSDTPDFTDVTEENVLYYSHVSVTEDGITAGEDIFNLSDLNDKFEGEILPRNVLYTETASGRELYRLQQNEEGISGRYIRLYLNNRQDNPNSENHIAELEVYGRAKDPYRLEELRALVEEAETEIASEKYTQLSVYALQDSVDRALKVLEFGLEEGQTVATVVGLMEEIKTNIRNLVIKTEGEEDVIITIPFMPEITATGATTASVTYTKAEGTYEITGYEITVYKKIGGEVVFNEVVEGTAATITNLVNNTEYFVSIKAVDAQGNVGPAKVREYTHEYEGGNEQPEDPEVTITAPTNLRAYAISETEATISYNSATGTNDIAGYNVVVTKKSDKTKVFEVAKVNATTVNAGGLTNDTEYVIEVNAVDSENNEGPKATLDYTHKYNAGDKEEPGSGSDNDGPESPSDNDPAVSDNDPAVSDNDVEEGLWIEGVEQEYQYTGQAIKPEVFVYEDGKLLIERKDYTLVHKNNKLVYTKDDEGSKAPYVEIKMKGNNTGSKKVYYKITPVDISTEAQLISDKLSAVVKAGKSQKVTPVVQWNGKNLKLNKDFKMTGGPSFSEGQYTVTIEGITNFTGTIEAQVNISGGKDVSGNTVVPMNKVTVKGYDKKPAWKEGSVTQDSVTVEYKKKALQKEEAGKVAEYTVEYGFNDAVGTAYMILTGTGVDGDGDGQVFVGTKTISYKITGTAMTKKNINVPKISDMTYTGDLIYPEIILNGGSMIEDVHYTASYTKNIEKGTATVTFKGIEAAGYTGSLKATFKIVPASVAKYTATVSGADIIGDVWQIPYTKGTTTPEWIVTTEEGEVLEAGKDYTVSYKNNKKVGETATATIKGKGNYGDVQSVSFKILKKELTNENGIQVVVKDKIATGKKEAWKQNVKVLDSNGKALSAKDYEKKSITFTKVVEPADPTKDIALSKTDIVKAGDVIRVTVKGAGDYAGDNAYATATFRMLNKGYDIAKATIVINPQEYTGEEITITDQKQFTQGKVFLKVNGTPVELKLGENIEVVEGSYVKNVNKGTAKVTFRGIGAEFGGSKTVTFKINPRNVGNIDWNVNYN